MKYLILIYSNPDSRKVWESFSDAERAEGYRYYAALTDALAESGELIVSEALADASQAKHVEVRAGETIASDGPFVEAKEHLAGFFLLECDTIDRAVEIAARMPEAEYGLVEVRPVMTLTGTDR